jgi:hypothetical protein
MKHIKLFEQFNEINEAVAMVKGIPAELFNLVKKVQLDQKVVGKNLKKQTNLKPVFRSEEEIAKLPEPTEALSSFVNSVDWMQDKNVKVDIDFNSAEIVIGKYLILIFNFDMGGNTFRISLSNKDYSDIKKVVYAGPYEDQIEAFKNVIKVNNGLWTAALNEAPQSTANEFLDDTEVQMLYKKLTKTDLNTRQLSLGVVAMSLTENPGADRKRELQEALKTIQKYLSDTDFIQADVQL